MGTISLWILPDLAHPEFLYLWLLLLPMVGYYIWRQRNESASLQFSSLKAFAKPPRTYKAYLRHAMFGLHVLALALLIFVLARPQSSENWENRTTRGIDIVLSMDVSGSMLARDFRPDRLEAAKDVAIEFISGRPDDRMGLVIFAGESFTQTPLTTDHAVVINMLKDIKSGLIEDGTAIGSGLATAVNRLKESDSKSKVIILLTDGVNNKGAIAPVTAAEIAQTFGIRVYTIGVGSMGTAPYPVQTPFGTQLRDVKVEIDEDVLKEIAQMTNGRYFRATSNEKLREIYKEIDKLEKSKIEVKEFSRKEEEYLPYALVALGFLLFAGIVNRTILRRIP
jgi:Ca-activated chloride channel family protein